MRFMKTIETSIQLVMKNTNNQEMKEKIIKEFENSFLSTYYSLLHTGIDHLVFLVKPAFYYGLQTEDEINLYDNMTSNKEVLEKIKSYFLNDYYFRISIIEKNDENSYTLKSYVTKEKKFFKSKYKEKTKEIYFIGTYLESVTLERYEENKDEKFDNCLYRYAINNYSIDPETGDYNFKLIWEKVRYGKLNIKMLPKYLKDYEFIFYDLQDRHDNLDNKKIPKKKFKKKNKSDKKEKTEE